MGDLYTHYYANSRHSGYVEAPSSAFGNSAWSRRIDDNDPPNFRARLLLTCGETVIVEGYGAIAAFDGKGQRLWKRSKWPGTQVVLINDRVYYTSEKQVNRFESIDLKNDIRQQDRHIPGVGSQDYLVLFEPSKEGLVAQVQFTNESDEVTCEMMVYQDTEKNLGFDWSMGFPGIVSPLIPLVCTDTRRLVTSIPGETLVFDLDAERNNPGPRERFPFPLGDHTCWVSCGPDGVLYWTGSDSEGLKIVATAANGKIEWRWCSGDEFNLTLARSNPVAPPIVTPERVYILTPRNIIALQKDIMLWNFESVRGEFYACTALSDDTILVTTRDTIYRLNGLGEIMFDLVFDEPIVTPPVIDSAGRVYVAGRETLHAIV